MVSISHKWLREYAQLPVELKSGTYETGLHSEDLYLIECGNPAKFGILVDGKWIYVPTKHGWTAENDWLKNL
jgi:hypothetical protein